MTYKKFILHTIHDIFTASFINYCVNLIRPLNLGMM